MTSRLHRLWFVLFLGSIAVGLATSQEPTKDKDKPKPPPPKTRSIPDALADVRVDKSLKVELWASEPLLANPVAIAFDEKGRLFVAETTRLDKGVPDNRRHMYWRDDDLASRTVADRLAIYKREYPGQKPYAGFEAYDDQVRLVWDSTGSGKADKSTIFANGFNQPQDGIAAGVLAHKGNVYFTCIPDVWLLQDTKGTNKADVRKSLSTGYGVRNQYTGHDLHGLRIGPDQKLYFSIGDRGLHVINKEGKTISNPHSGAVLRCDLDGGNLELVHTGLRNPQELAFDDFGNLFTYDNNADSGDVARWVYIVDGGESGWRAAYQYGTDYNPPWVKQGNRGAFNTEKMWVVPGPDGAPPASITPPIGHFGNGPSGITHYPGIGLSDRYKDHFFCTDFAGGNGQSAIWSLAARPKGAGFEMVDLHKFVGGLLPTDCEFGPDGGLYWSDWVIGWLPTETGRVFRVTDPEAMKNPAVAEAQKIIAQGFEKTSLDDLAKQLAHPHQLVRQGAHFELADRKAADRLNQVAATSTHQLARIHAIWGLGIIARRQPETIEALLALTLDKDGEVRAQAVKMLLGCKRLSGQKLADTLAKLMTDPEPRVRYFATLAYGQVDGADIRPILNLLKANDSSDLFLRHAGVQALVTSYRDRETGALASAWRAVADKWDFPAVRLGVLLALRRLGSPDAVAFLRDSDPNIVTEAARAIHDEEILKAYPQMAQLADVPSQSDAIAFRALNAAYVIGTPEQAGRVARFAARAAESDLTRAFALKLLGDWADPPRRDHVTGLITDLKKRPESIAVEALRPVIAQVFHGNEAVHAEAARVATKFELKEVGPLMAAVVRDATRPAAARVQALHAVGAVGDPSAKELVSLSLASPEPTLRAAARAVQAKTDPAGVLKILPDLLRSKTTSLAEKQGAFAIVAAQPQSFAADRVLIDWLDAVASGSAPNEIILDVLEAAESRTARLKRKVEPAVKEKLDAYRSALETKARDPNATDKLAPWAQSLAGGDADKGRHVFLNNTAASCQRCHKLDGQGGEVGPPINGVAAQNDRKYLLEALIFPNAKIAKGYETVNLTLADGRQVSGIIKGEDKTNLRLLTAEAKELVIPLEDIEARRTGASAMPEDVHRKLSMRELRDLVEFLASLKEPAKK